MRIFGGNLENYCAGKPLANLIDKEFTYRGSLGKAKL
jgi:hypothetical protein